MLRQLLQQALTIAPENQWPTYDDKVLDRSEFLTSSETASCLRQSYFGKQPGLKKFRGNGYTERGHAVEAWFVDKMRHLEEIGYKFQYLGADQRTFYDPDIGISGTPDGLMTTPEGKHYMLEIKSIDPRTNQNNLPREKHKYQVQQNMYLMQKCLGITLEGAILFYIDASDFFNTPEFPIQYDEKMVDECLKRARLLWDAEEADELDAEGLYNGDCDLCPFTAPCSASVDMQKELTKAGAAAAPFLASLPPEGEALLTEEEADAIHNFLYARAEAKEFNDQKEMYSELVKKIVVGRNGLVVAEGVALVATVSGGRETIDKKLMEMDGLDVSKYTKVGKPFVTLNVREPKSA